jgi:hypothetical protein
MRGGLPPLSLTAQGGFACFLLLLGLLFYREDGGSTFLRNVGEVLGRTVLHLFIVAALRAIVSYQNFSSS